MKLFGILSGKQQIDRVTKGLCNHGKHPTCTFQKIIQKKYKNLPEDSVPVFGHVVPPRHKIFARLYRSDHKRNFYHIDHAYFYRSHFNNNPTGKVWYRISKNGHMQTTLKDEADRKAGVAEKIKKTRRDINKIKDNMKKKRMNRRRKFMNSRFKTKKRPSRDPNKRSNMKHKRRLVDRIMLQNSKNSIRAPPVQY